MLIFIFLSIIIIQSIVIGLLVRFVLKHFTMTIEDIEELSAKQAKAHVDKFLKEFEG